MTSTEAMNRIMDDPDMLRTFCANIDLMIDAAYIVREGGEYADRLRERVKELKIQKVLEAAQ